MQAAPLPIDEPARLRTLRALRVLDTPDEPAYDAIARLARQQFDCSIGLISLIDEDRQWFKAADGLAVRQTPREIAFCAHAILHDDVMVVEDARADARFAGNPTVVSAPHLRFYAGAPLQVDGRRLGTVCTIDAQPRTFDATARARLQDLAQAASALLEARLREQRWLAGGAVTPGGESPFRLLFDRSPLPMWVHDARTLRFLQVNRAACAEYGHSEAEFLALGLLDVCPRHAVVQQAREAIGPAEPGFVHRWHHCRRDGSRLDVQVMVSDPMHFAGLPARLAIVVDSAGGAVRSRPGAGGPKADAAAVTVQRQFLSRVSRELRTPLHAVLGFAQLLELSADGNGNAARDARRYAGHIVPAAQQLLALVDGLLDVQAADSGRLPLRLTTIDLPALLAEVQELLTPLAASRALTLCCDLPAGLEVRGDAARLRHALMNLVSNALAYNLPGGRVRLRAGRTRSGQARLLIADNGRGMSPSDLERLREPLGGLGIERPQQGGTGLGFAIARALIEAMGGRLRVRSRPGRGTSVAVELPLPPAPSA